MAKLNNQSNMKTPELIWVDRVSRLLDSKFRIPGTRIRFGLDPVFGLLPVAGDVSTMLISLILIYTMHKHGASGKLLAKMILNVLADAVLGAIPIVGIFFDVYFKANNRNVHLLRAYYEDGKYRGSAKGIVISVLIVTILILSMLIYVSWLLVDYLIGLIT
jgi:hypothetical protein